MERFNIKIIYEDNHLLVVEKPVNIPVQKDETNDPDMLSLLKEDLKARYNKPGEAFLGLVHRLDRPVGGVMVFAKTSKAASRLSEQIRNDLLGKEYFAVVHGILKNKKGSLENYLFKDSNNNTSRVVQKSFSGSKYAFLEYEVEEENRGFSLIRIKLHTGRSHQIRVQFSHIGHPLYGDQKYGKSMNKVGQQIALWAFGITFIHPITKEKKEFKSTPHKLAPWDYFKFPDFL